MKPFPPGTVVTGVDPTCPIPARTECRGHVWRVNEPVRLRRDGWKGWLQSADCLVDGYESALTSPTWWGQKATRKDLEAALVLLERRMRGDRGRRQVLLALLERKGS